VSAFIPRQGVEYGECIRAANIRKSRNNNNNNNNNNIKLDSALNAPYGVKYLEYKNAPNIYK
jgi:hypothetical protein